MQTTLNSCRAIHCAEPTAADIAQLEENYGGTAVECGAKRDLL